MAADKAPYPGLRPFERDESHLFFGRDDCIDAMIARLAATRFLVVLGSSGTGKSSLVKTGLLSGLEMGLLSGAGSHWQIVDFRPGGNPLGSLARRLLATESADTRKDQSPSAPQLESLRERLTRQGPRALIAWCREGHLPAGTNLLLLVDQFEELFWYQDNAGREEAAAFVSLLLESRRPIEVENPQMAEFPIYVTITMRSEYLGACALIEGLAEAINEGTFLTPRMTRRQCEEAIVGPARVCGIEIEDRLVSKVLNDMANFAPWDEAGTKDQLSQLARRADQLPLMQHALNQMWHRARAQGDRITLRADDYHGLERELDDHAEQVLRDLGEPLQPTAEAVFRAVTSGTIAANAVRRPTRYGDLVEICGTGRSAVADVIAAFGPNGCQFLTSDMRLTGAEPPPDQARIDISHESLIRQWNRLSAWLEKEGRAAHDWQRLDEDAEHSELLTGQRLTHAIALREEFKPNPAWAARYGIDLDRIESLVNQSIAVRDEEIEREERRRAAELRRAKNTVYTVLGILVCVVLLAGYAVQKKREADAAVVAIEQANRNVLEQKAVAEQKAREASLALEDLVTEIRSSREASLSEHQTIDNLADDLVSRSSPLGALNARDTRQLALTKMRDHAGAIAELDAIIAADPDNVGALSSRSYAYLNVGRAADSIKDIDKVVSVRPTASAYNNLAIAKAILRDYDAAIAATKKAIAFYVPTESVFDAELSPDIETATGHSLITIKNYEVRVALGYQLALYYFFRGGAGFEEALDEADRANFAQKDVQEAGLGRSRAMNAYLEALNWAWQSSIWQYPDQIGIQDYGLYAGEGAIWERVAAVQPRYFDWARQSYQKFQKAFEKSPDRRYEALSKWVATRLARKEISAVASSPVRVAESQEPARDRQALALQAKEVKARSKGSSALSIAEPYRLISAAIMLLEKERAEKGADRPDLTDLLVSLLLDRADWRLDAGDRKSARDDALRIVEELNPSVSKALWLLAKTDLDDKARRAHYERALALNPANTAALWDYALLLANSEPRRALELHQRRMQFVFIKSRGYEEIARLQLKLGYKEEALRSVAAAISIVPFRTRLFELRRDIEVALGRSKERATAHLAAGYREAGDHYARTGDDAEALPLYLSGLDAVAGIANNSNDEDARFEFETAIRNLSEFIASHYSRDDAQQFWQSLATVNITKSYRARVQREVARLAAEP